MCDIICSCQTHKRTLSVERLVMRTKAVDARQPFRFGWEVPVDGYRCEPGGALDDQLREQDQKSELMLVEAIPLGAARMVRRHRTLDENTGLFLNFAAQIDVTPDGIIAFANQYRSEERR